MRVILGMGIAVVLAALGVLVVIYSGRYDVAADQKHHRLTEWVLETSLRRSVRAQARSITAPSLGDPVLVEEGARRYKELCEACHGGPGIKPASALAAMSPEPTELPPTVREWSSAELFWIVRHGLKFTGMPAFGKTHVDAELWPVVAFLGQLPDLTPERYGQLTAPPPPPQPEPAPEAQANPPEGAPPADGAPAGDSIPPSEEAPEEAPSQPQPAQPEATEPAPQGNVPMQLMPPRE